jgi:hypothetical protein
MRLQNVAAAVGLRVRLGRVHRLDDRHQLAW